MSWENKQIQPFTFYCQKILPLVYDESLSYYETLCKIQKVLNEVIGNQNNLNNAFTELLNYVNAQLEIYTKEQLEEWLDDGTLENIVHSLLSITTTYETTDDMKTQNLVENQIVQTINNHNNDRYGALYKVSQNKDDSTFSVLLNNGLYANMIIFNYFNAEQIDDTDLDNILPKVLKSNMTLILTNRNFTITYDENKYSDLKNVFIDFSNSKITVKTPYQKTHANIIKFYNCENIRIKGGEFNGMCALNGITGESTEWCHCFSFIKTTDYEVSHMVIHDFCGDGIESGNQLNDVYIDMDGYIHDIEIYNCHRNGISILDSGTVKIEDCNIHDITQLSTNPTSEPLCTIDFEPYFTTQKFKKIVLKNIKGGNAGGLGFWGCEYVNAYVENCEDQTFTCRTYIEHETLNNIFIIKDCLFTFESFISTNGVYDIHFQKKYNNYRALRITMSQQTILHDYFITGDIVLIGEQTIQTQQIYCEKYNNQVMTDNSYVELKINSGFAFPEGFNTKSVIDSDIYSQTNYPTLFSTFNGNFKTIIFTGSTLNLAGKDILKHECTIIFTQQCTLSVTNDEVTYTGFTTGSISQYEVLKLTPYYVGNTRYVNITKL